MNFKPIFYHCTRKLMLNVFQVKLQTIEDEIKNYKGRTEKA
jgi:hypothetical protein